MAAFLHPRILSSKWASACCQTAELTVTRGDAEEGGPRKLQGLDAGGREGNAGPAQAQGAQRPQSPLSTGLWVFPSLALAALLPSTRPRVRRLSPRGE